MYAYSKNHDDPYDISSVITEEISHAEEKEITTPLKKEEAKTNKKVILKKYFFIIS